MLSMSVLSYEKNVPFNLSDQSKKTKKNCLMIKQPSKIAYAHLIYSYLHYTFLKIKFQIF